MSEQEDYERAKKIFASSFHSEGEKFVSYGRLEIIGNHTDHQGGHCLVAGCSLGLHGYLSKADDGLVSIASEGYGKFNFPAGDLTMKDSEKFSSIGLVRGVMSYLSSHGFKVGAFRASLTSDIFSGAGVSSSAAYELFVGEAINHLFNGDSIPRIVLAKAGQYAENVYFGKASGLLDQCGSSFGGLSYLDFHEAENPIVKPFPIPSFFDSLHIVLVNPGLSHAGLSHLYSEMPLEMRLVAKKLFGKEILSQVEPKEFYEKIFLDKELPLRPKQRALHYFDEDARVGRAYEAMKGNNLEWFLELERESQISQTAWLQNVMVPGQYNGSPLEAVERAKEVLKKGASRVMGGGLVGSSINFVPDEEFAPFMKLMIAYYGEKGVREVSIPPFGAHIL